MKARAPKRGREREKKKNEKEATAGFPSSLTECIQYTLVYTHVALHTQPHPSSQATSDDMDNSGSDVAWDSCLGLCACNTLADKYCCSDMMWDQTCSHKASTSPVCAAECKSQT